MIEKKSTHVEIVEDRPRGFISRFVRTTMVVLIIVYAATLLISRTDGFRHMVEERLKKRIGAELTLGKAHMSVRLDLILRDLADANVPGADTPGFHVKHATIRWSFPELLRRRPGATTRMAIEGADFQFVRDEEGRWQPAVLAEAAGTLSAWAGLGVPASPASRAASPAGAREKGPAVAVAGTEGNDPFRRETAYVVRETGMRWAERDGTVLAELRGVRLDVTPIRVPARDMQHVRLTVDEGMMADGRAFRELDVELLVTDQQTLLMNMKADWGRD